MSDNTQSNDNTGHNPVGDLVDKIGHKILEELNKHGISAPDNVNKASGENSKKQLIQAERFLPVVEIHQGHH